MFLFGDISLPQAGMADIRVLKKGDPVSSLTNGTLYLQAGKQQLRRFSLANGSLCLLGDPILEWSLKLASRLQPEGKGFQETVLYEEVPGHYLWVFRNEDSLRIGSSFGAIYPLYWSRHGNRIAFSSSSYFLADYLGLDSGDFRNLLERILFNYALFDSTWWPQLKLLPAHRYLQIGRDTGGIEGDFNIADYFGSGAEGSPRALDELVGVFQEEVERFFPAGPMAISLTGGFDGRVLVGAAEKAGKSFSTYSFGCPGTSDLNMPIRQARKLGIRHRPIILDDAYFQQDALPSARSFMRLSEGNGNLGRPHYHFAARHLAKETPCIITGNFGSELFRALHLPGVMISQSLIDLFSSPGLSWKDKLARSIDQLQDKTLRACQDALFEDLEAYLKSMRDWEPNHRFYHFVFQELFRKYFGPELLVQRNFLSNRTPFLNLRFIRALHQTRWAGIHSRLYEKSRLKRMKGQFFYATYLKRNSPSLYRLNTNKGYAPADIRDPQRFPLLLAKMIRKKILGKREDDQNGVIRFFALHQQGLADDCLNGPLPEVLRQLIETAGMDSGVAPSTQQIKWFGIAMGWVMAAGQKSPALLTP